MDLYIILNKRCLELLHIEEVENMENIKKYMLLGSEQSHSMKDCIKNAIAIIIFIIPMVGFILIDRRFYPFAFFYFVPFIIHIVSVMKLKKGNTIEGIKCMLYNGIFVVCMSLVFTLAGIELMMLFLFEGKGLIIAVSIIIIGYALMFMFYYFVFKRQKERVKSIKQKNNIWIPFTLCGVLGISIGKNFVQVMDNITIVEITCILAIFLSYFLLMGVLNIFKYRYITQTSHTNWCAEP